MTVSIELIQGDITKLEVDAIVNAANEMLIGGAGVDGAIHDAAGDKLLEACLAIPEVRPRVRCPTGTCQITSGFNLPAKFVIHTVGPIWRGGGNGEPELLRSCYRNSMRVANERGFRTIAFPAISCGVYGYPVDEAASIAVETIRAFESETNSETDLEIAVKLVAFDAYIYGTLEAALNNS